MADADIAGALKEKFIIYSPNPDPYDFIFFKCYFKTSRFLHLAVDHGVSAVLSN